MRRLTPVLCLLTGLWASLSLSGEATAEPVFHDVTAASGVSFVHNTGAFGDKWLPETMGSGVVVLDYNGDQLPDLLFLNGTAFAGKPGRKTTQALYRNQGGLRFSDVTAQAGLALEAYCMGGAAGDLDNDGDPDLYLSCLGTDFLLVNEGGRFIDRSSAAGLSRKAAFGASVALLDADRDGLLDIFATRYVSWTPESDIRCTKYDPTKKSYCTPEPYRGASPLYYRNLGDLHFEDATVSAGVSQPNAKSLGVAILDIDADGWLDLAVANDTQPNLLYRNRGDGTFEETGLLSGIAFGENGVARGAMGIDAADYNRSGRQDLVIGNFANEMVTLYRNEGNLLFVDEAPVAKIGRSTLLSLTFGAFFFDYDLDGYLDLLFANGHLEAEAENTQTKVRYAQPTQLFRNTGGSFEEVTDSAGGDLAKPRVARGAVWGDLDGDGDPDVAISTNGGPAVILRNDGDGHGHWLQVELAGSKSNRDGLGAVVELTAGGSTQSWLVRTGGSYLSQSQLAPLFGLGAATSVDRLVVRWPSGAEQQVTVDGVDRVVRVAEDL